MKMRDVATVIFMIGNLFQSYSRSPVVAPYPESET